MKEKNKRNNITTHTKEKIRNFACFIFIFMLLCFCFLYFLGLKQTTFEQILAYMKGESKKMIIILPITFLLIDYYSFNQRNFTFVKIFFIVLLGCQRHAREAQAYCMLCRF